MRILQLTLIALLSLLCIGFVDAAKTPDPYKVLGISRSATED